MELDARTELIHDADVMVEAGCVTNEYRRGDIDATEYKTKMQELSMRRLHLRSSVLAMMHNGLIAGPKKGGE